MVHGASTTHRTQSDTIHFHSQLLTKIQGDGDPIKLESGIRVL